MYNYSPWLLEANKDLVNYLMNLSEQGGQAEVTFDSYEEARNYRLKILEILANITRNKPELARLRAPLRTSIGWKGERYVVKVGVPKAAERLKGAKPKLPLAATMAAHEFGIRLVIEEIITAENWPDIAVKLAAAKQKVEVDYIIFTHPPDTKGVAFIAEQMEPQYQVLQTKPHLILEKNASANVARASSPDPERKDG